MRSLCLLPLSSSPLPPPQPLSPSLPLLPSLSLSISLPLLNFQSHSGAEDIPPFPIPPFPLTHAEILAHIQSLASTLAAFQGFSATLVSSLFASSCLPTPAPCKMIPHHPCQTHPEPLLVFLPPLSTLCPHCVIAH